MAVWQFDLEFLPRQVLLKVCGDILPRLPKEMVASTDWWQGVEPPPDYQKELNSLFDNVRAESWHPELAIWGEMGGNRVDVMTEAGKVDSVSVRIDVRLLDTDFLEGIIGFAQHCDCLLLTRDRELLEPRLELLYEAIRRSPTQRFVEDPLGYLRQLEP